jgi:hypothetical protein
MTSADSIYTLEDLTTRQASTFDLGKRTKTIPIRRGERVEVIRVQGHGVITQLWLTFPGWFWQHWNPTAPVNPAILKTLILRIYWDDAETPAVESPMADFFGNGLCEATNFASRYFGMSSGGFFCRFPMPFRTGFRVEVENRDRVCDTDLFANILYQVPEQIPAEAAYFHAQFHTASNPGPDPVEILEAHGRGHFAGCTLAMQAEERNYLSFLEAPEYIYIDDDWERPRICGTGLEDYFLGGWYFREGPFTGPIHGVPSKDTLNGSVAMYRVHDQDAIHFRRRIRHRFVNPWEPDRLRPFRWSSTAFLYLERPEGTSTTAYTTDQLMCWYRVRQTDHQSIP